MVAKHLSWAETDRVYKIRLNLLCVHRGQYWPCTKRKGYHAPHWSLSYHQLGIVQLSVSMHMSNKWNGNRNGWGLDASVMNYLHICSEMQCSRDLWSSAIHSSCRIKQWKWVTPASEIVHNESWQLANSLFEVHCYEQYNHISQEQVHNEPSQKSLQFSQPGDNAHATKTN
mgnify:FL=1